MHTLLILASLALLLSHVEGHFTLSGPVPSREKQEYPDNRRFFPIAGGSTLRPLTDCLKYQRRQVASLSVSEKVTLPFEIGNFASHIGLCTAVLVNLDNSKQTSLGQVQDCVSRDKAITVTMPATACANCVIKVSVTAVHLGPNNPEFYDSCVDVNVGGSGGTGDDDDGSDDGDDAPSAPADAPLPSPAKAVISSSTTAATATTTTAKTTTAKTTTAPTTAIKTTKTAAPTVVPAVCKHGDFACGADGQIVRHCVYGKFVDFKVAPGTLCKSIGSGKISIVNR